MGAQIQPRLRFLGRDERLAHRLAVAPPHRTVRNLGKRADVRLPNGRVIEFQHSPPSVPDIEARERHYGPMVPKRSAPPPEALAGAVPLNIDLAVVLIVLPTPCAPPCAAESPATQPPPPTPCNAGSCPRRAHPQPRQPDRGPPRPAHLLTRTAPSQPARDLRPLARRPHRALRVRMSRHKMWVNSLSENRR